MGGMTDDLRKRVDQFFASGKTLAGPFEWYESERAGVQKFQREVREDGVSRGFRIEGNALMGSDNREFRFMVIGLGQCLFRLDCAPVLDGTHVNGPNRPLGFPMGIDGPHYHPWAENRKFSTPNKIHDKLPYALEIPSGIANIRQGFRVFCDLVGITALTADDPDWPKPTKLL